METLSVTVNLRGVMNERYKEFLDELEHSYRHETFSAPFDTEVLWFEENRSLFIRGTDSCVDWFFNLLAVPTFHQSFHLGWHLKASALINSLIDRRMYPTTVVGHSAGGAIAQWAGYVLNCEAYSLACPRTVFEKNTDFGKWADEKLVIINQENDWVTKIPHWFKHPIEPLVLNTADYPIFAHNLISFE